jgi:hypothetical protein
MQTTSQETGKQMKNIRLMILTILMTMIINAQAADSSSRYQAWQPPGDNSMSSSPVQNDERLKKMIDELNKLIDDADKARAADRRFIEDLRDIVNQYDWPWRKSIMQEDFTDGYMNKDSNWQIISGDFKLERGSGLHSDIQTRQPEEPTSDRNSKEEAAALLLGAILEQALNDGKGSNKQAPNADHAMIASKKTISNAFAIDINLDVRSIQGHFELGVYQGNPGGPGYRLVFLPGSNASLELQRISRRGKSIIEVAEKISATGDRIHQLQWTRAKDGNMKVILNGKDVLHSADRSYKDAFTGIDLKNLGGAFSVKQLTIHGI